MIKVDGISKSFGSNIVISNLSLALNKGEFAVIIGPSGCGKTTLLNMIAGYNKPDFGSIEMNGELVAGPSKDRAVISQDNALFPWYNVYDNIAYGLRLSKIDEREIDLRTKAILKDIELSEAIDKKIFELSGGMKQRVALAQVLINQPQLILLDEPLGALDTITRHNMQQLIHDLWKAKNLTMLMITHDIDEALLLATKIYVMTADGLVEFSPKFYKNDNYDTVYIDTEFLEMKKEIMKLV